jgi:hypothetical protein
MDGPEDTQVPPPWYASIRDRPSRRRSSDRWASRGGKAVLALVFLAGISVIAVWWSLVVLPLLHESPHQTAICWGKLHGCLMVSGSDEWFTVLLESAIPWAIAGALAYGAAITLKPRPVSGADPSTPAATSSAGEWSECRDCGGELRTDIERRDGVCSSCRRSA